MTPTAAQTAVLALLAVALFCWPDRPRVPRPAAGAVLADRRSLAGDNRWASQVERFRGIRLSRLIRRLSTNAQDAAGGAGRTSIALAGGVMSGPAGWALAGPPVGLAVGLLATTAISLVQGALARRGQHRDRAALATSLHLLARELRAGSVPEQALRAAASVIRIRGSTVVADLLDVVGFGGAGGFVGVGGAGGVIAPRVGPPGVPTAVAAGLGSATGATVMLIAGWQLSAKYGVPWAALVEAAAADLDQQLQVEGATQAQLAGPRMSGYVLSVLPAFGLLLGAGMGADPLRVLTTTPAGGALLIVGTALTCAGLAWTGRIVRL